MKGITGLIWVVLLQTLACKESTAPVTKTAVAPVAPAPPPDAPAYPFKPGPPCPKEALRAGVHNKTDLGLTMLYRDYQNVKANGVDGEPWKEWAVKTAARKGHCGTVTDPCPSPRDESLADRLLNDRRLAVRLRFCGDAAAVLAHGVELVAPRVPVDQQQGGEATALVRLSELEHISSCPGVIRMSWGSEPQLHSHPQ